MNGMGKGIPQPMVNPRAYDPSQGQGTGYGASQSMTAPVTATKRAALAKKKAQIIRGQNTQTAAAYGIGPIGL